MKRHPAIITRIARTATALATVWSLGCCGFEPLLSDLFAADRAGTMPCADDGGSGERGSGNDGASNGGASNDGASNDGASSVAGSIGATSHGPGVAASAAFAGVGAAVSGTAPAPDDACTCTNCLAPSPPVAVHAVMPVMPPRAIAAVAASAPSVVRTPLVPPPQTSATGA